MSQQGPSQSESSGRGFSIEGRTVDASRPIEWIKAGWQLFVKNPGIWIAQIVIGCVILAALGLVPLLGQLVVNIAAILFIGGLLLGCRSLSQGGDLRLDYLFAGFKHNTGNLVMVGVYYTLGLLAIVAVVFAIGGGGILSGALIGRVAGAGVMAGGILLAALVALALFFPLAMAVWFAPPLVVFHNIAPLEAMRASFSVCMRNFWPFLFYSLILLILIIAAAIPALLGFLVLLPVVVGAHYASYMDLFE